MTISSDDFRSVLRQFASGVTIVTIQAGGQRHGLTVSAFTSISTAPALIMVAINNSNTGSHFFEQADASFAVNILGADQQALSNRFAWVKDEDRFAMGQWTTALTGAPILADAVAWLDCTIHSQLKAGTHTIYVGEVRACGVPRQDEAPLDLLES